VVDTGKGIRRGYAYACESCIAKHEHGKVADLKLFVPGEVKEKPSGKRKVKRSKK